MILQALDFNGGARVFDIVNAFVEADRRFDLALKLGVGKDVVPAKRLLDHDEVEGVELLQKGRVFEAISGVGVGHQADAREALAERADRLDIVARLDFDFDALVAGGESFFHFCNQRGGGRLDSDRNAAGNFVARAAEKFGERQIFLLGLGVPERGFERGFGHVVAAHGREQVPHFRSGGDFFSFQQRPKMIAQNQPGGFHRFVGIEGIFAGG